jgi:amidase
MAIFADSKGKRPAQVKLTPLLLAACTSALIVAAPASHSQSTRSAPSADAVRTFDVMEKSIAELQQAMQAGAVTSKQLTTIFLARIRAYDKAGPRLNAIIALNPHALDSADALDRERASGRVRGPLHGIPIVIKDNFETADLPTTAGSLALAGFATEHDAFQVRRLRDAGAVIIGKTNLHELASGITTISSLGGQTLNPYDLNRTPGGSSGGTGAAVAANFAVAGMGSDTCGSIRIPSANNNLFGLRGTSGLSSRTGIVPLSHTQDIGGPLARTVTDLAVMLDATVGADPADPITARSNGHVPGTYRGGLNADGLKGVRLGVLKQLFGSGPEDEEVGRIVRAAIESMKKAGAEPIEITVPGLEEQMQGSSVINAEFKFDLFDYLAHFPNAPVHSLADILASGRYDSSLEANFRTRNRPEARDTDDYRRAMVKRNAVRQLVLSALEEHRLDGMLYPTLRRPPAVIGEPQRGSNCQLSPSTGLPVIAMPAGFSEGGAPIGFELLGAEWSEPKLLAMAYAYEQAARPRRTPYSTPPLINGAAPPPVTFEATAAGVTVRFTYDVATSRLAYSFTRPADVLSVTVHRTSSPSSESALGSTPPSPQVGVGEPRRSPQSSPEGGGGTASAERPSSTGRPQENGPVIALLSDDSSAITLGAVDRGALAERALYLEVVTRLRTARALLHVP